MHSEIYTVSPRKETFIAVTKQLLTDKKLILTAIAFNLITAGCTTILPILFGRIIDKVEAGDITNFASRALIMPLMGILFAMCIQFVFASVSRRVEYVMGEKVIRHFREHAFKNTLDLSFATLQRFNTGDLTNRLSADFQIATDLMRHGLPETVTGIVTGLAVIGCSLCINWILGLCLCSGIGFLIASRKLYSARLYEQETELAQLRDQTLTHLMDNMQGIMTITSLGLQNQRNAITQQQLTVQKSAEWHNVKLFLKSARLTQMGYYFPLLMIVLFGALLYRQGYVSLGDVSAVTLLAISLIGIADGLLEWSAEYKSSILALGRIFGIGKIKAYEETVEPEKIPISTERKSTAQNLFHGSLFTGTESWESFVNLEHVSFQYPTGKNDRKTLEDINVHFPSQSQTAIIGASGCGKSTLGYLIAQLYQPATGTISYASPALSEEAILIPQEPHVFAHTLQFNLTAGKHYPEITINTALQLSHLDRWVKENDIAYATTILSDHAKIITPEISQKISVARLMINPPALLILDESLAHIPDHEAAIIERNLLSQLIKTTIIHITHRLDTLPLYSNIIIMDGGKILEQGTYEELLQHKNSSLHTLLKN